MDDSSTIKKKKFSGIRKLGKFFGLGGSATKSETKSQVDDYEDLDLSAETNGIDSIMALTAEQKALPVILLSEPEPKPISPTSVNSLSGFKPKSLPSSLSRVPGRALVSPRNQESVDIHEKVSSQEELPSPVVVDPTPAPAQTPVVTQIPTQRVEDIIRLKIPLHRRTSKLKPSESQEIIEPKVPPSPVAVDVYCSPISPTDQKSLLSSDDRVTPTHELQESKSFNEKSSAPCLKVVQITLDLSSESMDSPAVASEPTLVNYRSSSTDDPLRCTSFDPEVVVEEITRMKSTSCDSEDSFTHKISQSLLTQPIIGKSKEDLRAEFLSFRKQNSKFQRSRSGKSSDENGDDDDESVSSYSSDDIESVVSSDEERDNFSGRSLSAIESGSQILRTESIPEGDHENSDEEQVAMSVKVALSQSISTDTSDVSLSDLRVTAIKPKRQHASVGKPSSHHGSRRLSTSTTATPTTTTGSTKSAKRTKSIAPNQSSSTNGGWNGSVKNLTASKSSNPPPNTQPPSTKPTPKSRRHSAAHTSNASHTLRSTHSLEHCSSISSTSQSTDTEVILSSTSSRDLESPEIKVTKISTNARASVDSNRRKSMATSSGVGR